MEKEAKKKLKQTALCGLLNPNLGKTGHLHDIMHDQNGKDGVKNSGPPSDPLPSQWSKLLESSEHALNWSSLMTIIFFEFRSCFPKPSGAVLTRASIRFDPILFPIFTFQDRTYWEYVQIAAPVPAPRTDFFIIPVIT